MALGLAQVKDNLETGEHLLVLNPEQEKFLDQRQTETAGYLDEQAALYLGKQKTDDKLLQPLFELQELDSLTKLLNRRGAMRLGMQFLQETKEKGNYFVAVAIDLDHFKAYNDVLGQKFGDFVLQEVARGLFQTYSNVASRMGGEELFFVFNVHSKETFTEQDLLQHVQSRAESLIADIREVLHSSLQTLDEKAVIDENKKRELEDLFEESKWGLESIPGAKRAVENFLTLLEQGTIAELKESFYNLHAILAPLLEPGEVDLIADFMSLAQAIVNGIPSLALQNWVWDNKESERPQNLEQIEIGGVTAGALILDFRNSPEKYSVLDEYEQNRKLSDELRAIMNEANLIEEEQKASARNRVLVEMKEAKLENLNRKGKKAIALKASQKEFIRERSEALVRSQRHKMRDIVSSIYLGNKRQEELKEVFRKFRENAWYQEYEKRLAEINKLRRANVPEAELQDKLQALKDLDSRRKLLKKLIENTKESYCDPLTGVPNRHFFAQESARLFEKCQVKGKPFVIAMLDLDNFKAVNETFGHFFGDIVLQYSTSVWQEILADFPSAELVRIGGEEFAIVLSGLDEKASKTLLNELRIRYERAMQEFYSEMDKEGAYEEGFTKTQILDYVRKHKKETQPVGTLSMGFSLATKDDASIWTVKERADRAFKKAKQAGRNRVERL